MRKVDQRSHDLVTLLTPRHRTDEYAVDFQRIERETVQVAKTGVAGAEVVDRKLGAGILQLVQHLVGHFRIVHQQAFGNFKLDTLSTRPGLIHDIGKHRNQELVIKLFSRKIDCNHHILVEILRQSALESAGLLGNPVSDFGNNAAAFRFPDKLGRTHDFARGMLPAQQCLATDNRI